MFFRRKYAGAVMPVHLMLGTYDAPNDGLDLPAKKASPGNKP
jgi:hypothetical protein